MTPLDRSLGVPAGDRERALAADQDLDHRPGARQRAAAGALRGQDRGPRCGCSCSPTRRRATTGTTTGDLERDACWSPPTTPRQAPSPPRRRSRQTSSGYRGTVSDPWRDLAGLQARPHGRHAAGQRRAGRARRARRQGQPDDDAGDRLRPRRRPPRRAAATGSLASGFDAAKAAYDSGWSSYLASLKAPPAPVAGDAHMKRLYEQSLLVLAGLEDKTHRGASIAAPNMPWIWGTLTLADDKKTSDPYHLVWPRDFYHAATAQKAAGDDAAADRLVDYLWRVQKPEGDFWQNTRVDGTPIWKSQQLDETALPVVLAWWLGRTAPPTGTTSAPRPTTSWPTGPRTGQERWENQDGYSPNTIATEIAGARVRRRRREDATATPAARPRTWPRPTSGRRRWRAGPRRRTAPTPPGRTTCASPRTATPTTDSSTRLGDNFPRQVDQREIVDNSFLGPRAVRRQAPRRHRRSSTR